MSPLRATNAIVRWPVYQSQSRAILLAINTQTLTNRFVPSVLANILCIYSLYWNTFDGFNIELSRYLNHTTNYPLQILQPCRIRLSTEYFLSNRASNCQANNGKTFHPVIRDI